MLVLPHEARQVVTKPAGRQASVPKEPTKLLVEVSFKNARTK